MRLSWVLPLSAALPVWTASTGKFNVLSFNIAGLPAIFNNNGVPGDKSTNAETIGTKFAQYGYDVIQVQEDFNYHAHLYKTDNHPYRTATSGGAAIGSGLNTLANYPWIDFQRVKWESCTDITGADCLTPKGFTMMRVRFDEGVYVDFYNIHADAGTVDRDIQARADNLQQVANHIQTHSAGNAVLVYGDTNARYTTAGENIRVFKDQNLMADAWVDFILHGQTPREGISPNECSNPTTNNTCETLDKIFYRGSRILDLKLTHWGYEDYKFLSDDGSILADHNPVTSNFTWALSSSLRQTDLFGGPHGAWFNDVDSMPDSSTGDNKPRKISLRGAERLNSVELTLGSGQNYTHGGSGGAPHDLTLGDDEYWTRARLCQGKHNDHTRIFYLLATTSAGNTVGAGQVTDDCTQFTTQEGWQIVGFYGRDGDEVDRLGFITAKV